MGSISRIKPDPDRTACVLNNSLKRATIQHVDASNDQTSAIIASNEFHKQQNATCQIVEFPTLALNVICPIVIHQNSSIIISRV